MRQIDTVCEALHQAARSRPDDVAYTTEGDSITYGTLLDDARHLARRLVSNGVTTHERCAIVLPTSLDFIRAVYATQLAGGVPVAINCDLTAEAIVRRIALVRARLAIGVPSRVEQLRPEARIATDCTVTTLEAIARSNSPVASPDGPVPGDPAFLQLTSGTTGEPRAAVISHRSLMASLTMTSERIAMNRHEVLATWAPLHHDLGLVRYVFGAMVSGCPSHLIRPSIVNLQPWLELVSRTRATITGGPDSAYRLAARTVDPASLNLRSLRFAGNGGETVRLSTIESFEQKFGLPGVVRPAYGLAEATLTVASTASGEPLRVDESGTVSCGRRLDGIDLRIADAVGRPLPTGTTGEILIQGAPVFDGYFDDESATRSTLRDGWLHTGDMGSMDAQGYLFLQGRSRALIKRGGATIAPREIEDAVDRVADVDGSAALGLARGPDSGTEEIVVVAEMRSVARQGPGSLDAIVNAIDREVKKSLGSAPGRILLVTAGTIPRTAAGKVRYDELRRMVVENSGGDRVLADR